MDYLSLYHRIVHSDLRPNLEQYSTTEGLKELEASFYSLPFNPRTDDAGEFLDRAIAMDPDHKPGDIYEIKIDEESFNITITKKENPDEEELINIDIPPAEDEKGEIYCRIIDDEYKRIKAKLVYALNEASKSEDIKFTAEKTIARAKQLARDAHLFNKRLGNVNTPSSKSSQYVISTLKKYFIYIILDVQDMFGSFVSKVQDESELEDELFEFSATKLRRSVERLSKELNKKHLARLHQQTLQSATLQEQIDFFKTKVSTQIAHIESSKRVYRGDIDTKELYLGELGRLLKIQLSDKLFQIEQQTLEYKMQLTYLLKEQAKLLSEKNSIEYQALSKTDFLDQLALRIKLFQDLISIDTQAHSAGLIGDVAISALLVQARTWVHKEDHLNDYLTDLLRSRGYVVSDQSRRGRSLTNKEAGSLDLAIHDKADNRIVLSIIESFILDSCGPENTIVGPHLKKLVEHYDTSGNKENIAIIFAKATDFEKLWNNYRKHVDEVVFPNQAAIHEINYSWLPFANLKIGVTELTEKATKRNLYHVFINMHLQEELEFNVKAVVTQYSPELFELIKSRVDWRKLSKSYKERYNRMISNYESVGTFQYEASILEIFLHAANGRRQAKYIVTYVNESVQKLKQLLTPEELKLVIDNLSGMVTNLDTKYLNFVGEIGILVIIKQHCSWMLVDTEIQNAAGKRLDYYFETKTGKRIALEIMNIHLTKEVSEIDADVQAFLDKRITNKIKDKTGDDPNKFDFLIAPVVWGPVEELKRMASYLKRNVWAYTQVLKPVAFVNFTDGQINVEQRFKDLETIFDDARLNDLMEPPSE